MQKNREKSFVAGMKSSLSFSIGLVIVPLLASAATSVIAQNTLPESTTSATAREAQANPSSSKNKRPTRSRAQALRNLDAQRKIAATQAVSTSNTWQPERSAASRNATLTYTPATAPLPPNLAAARARSTAFSASALKPEPSARRSSMFASNAASSSVVLIAPTSIDAHILHNLHEPLVAPDIEMGDRPARGTSLCGDGRNRRFGDVDIKALAQNLPDFNSVRPRTVCVRRGVLMADYGFK